MSDEVTSMDPDLCVLSTEQLKDLQNKLRVNYRQLIAYSAQVELEVQKRIHE